MDIIFLRELKVETLIGVYEWEKRVPQTLQLDAVFVKTQIMEINNWPTPLRVSGEE